MAGGARRRHRPVRRGPATPTGYDGGAQRPIEAIELWNRTMAVVVALQQQLIPHVSPGLTHVLTDAGNGIANILTWHDNNPLRLDRPGCRRVLGQRGGRGGHDGAGVEVPTRPMGSRAERSTRPGSTADTLSVAAQSDQNARRSGSSKFASAGSSVPQRGTRSPRFRAGARPRWRSPAVRRRWSACPCPASAALSAPKCPRCAGSPAHVASAPAPSWSPGTLFAVGDLR